MVTVSRMDSFFSDCANDVCVRFTAYKFITRTIENNTNGFLTKFQASLPVKVCTKSASEHPTEESDKFALDEPCKRHFYRREVDFPRVTTTQYGLHYPTDCSITKYLE